MKTFKQFNAELNEAKSKFDVLGTIKALSDPNNGIYPQEMTAAKDAKITVRISDDMKNTSKGAVPDVRKLESARVKFPVEVKKGDSIIVMEDGSGYFGDRVVGFYGSGFWTLNLRFFEQKVGIK